MSVGLLTCGDGCRRFGIRGIRWRRLVRGRIDHLDRAFADRYLHAGGSQVDVKCSTDRAHPTIAGVNPERALRVVSDFEIRLATFETNDPAALAVVNLNPAVGIEIERGAIRQRHRSLLTNRRLKAGRLFLLVQIPGYAENDYPDGCGHRARQPAARAGGPA